jgi:hypothetical protein
VAPRRHLTLQVLLSALALAGGLLGLQNRPVVHLTAGTPTQHVSALQVIDTLQAPSKATRDLYATSCGLATRYCVLRSSSKPRDLADDVVEMLLHKGARRVDGHCPSSRRVDAVSCHQRLELNGVGLLVLAGNEVGAGTRVPTFAGLYVVGEPVVQPRPPAPLPALSLLGLVPAGTGSAPCVRKSGAGCAEYRGLYSAAGSVRGVAAVWRARFGSLGYRVDTDSCYESHCLLAASRFRAFGGQDGMLVTLIVDESGPTQVVQRLRVTLPALTTP